MSSEASEAGPSVAAGAARWTPRQVLVVGRSGAAASLVAVLRAEMPGVSVSVTGSLAGALGLLPQRFEVVVTELLLPDARGLDVIRAILSASPETAVLVRSQPTDADLSLRVLTEGAEDVLDENASDAVVARAVLHAAARRRARVGSRTSSQVASTLLDALEASTCAVDANGVITAVNRAWRDFAADNGGDPSRSGIGSNYFAVCDAVSGPEAGVAGEVSTGLRQLLAGAVARFEADYPCHSPDQQRWISVRATALPDSGAVLTHVDISHAKRAEQALSHETLHDGLTNLPNRQLLVDRVRQALAMTARTNRNVAVAFLDIDQFKRVNDTLGHPAGDQLLCAVADRLLGHVRASDTVARFAGDEFVIVWPSVDSASEAESMVQRLLEAMTEPFALTAATVEVTASVGLAVGRAPRDVDDMLAAADAAMYDAKSHGRGLATVHDERLRQDSAARMLIGDELRAGLANGEFELYYQPVVSLRSGSVRAVEAVLRWNHRSGTRMPESFLPVAELSGLSVPLGAWALEQACRQQVAWVGQGLDLRIVVDLSARQIIHPAMLAGLERTLQSTGMPADRLWMQVSESTVHQDADHARAVFGRIQALGAAMVIGEFGTGYSSLRHLRGYPVRALKVDRQFVLNIGVEAADEAIVASVATLSEAIGAICIADGVETPAQYGTLVALGCRYAQGPLFGDPVAATSVPDVVNGYPLPSARSIS